MRHTNDSPAMGRPERLQDGLAMTVDWGKDADEVPAPAFTAHVPTDVFLPRIRHREPVYAPLTS